MTGSYSRTVMDGSWLVEPQHTVPLRGISVELRLREVRCCCYIFHLYCTDTNFSCLKEFSNSPCSNVKNTIIAFFKESRGYSVLVFQSCLTYRVFSSFYETFHDIRDSRWWNPNIRCNRVLLLNSWTIFPCSFSQTGELYPILACKQCPFHT